MYILWIYLHGYNRLHILQTTACTGWYLDMLCIICHNELPQLFTKIRVTEWHLHPLPEHLIEIKIKNKARKNLMYLYVMMHALKWLFTKVPKALINCFYYTSNIFFIKPTQRGMTGVCVGILKKFSDMLEGYVSLNKNIYYFYQDTNNKHRRTF